MNEIGHNNGPSMEGGRAFRKFAWGKARADLIPNLPIEILRNRVRRAKELGLPYKTYASVRASTGRDVVGFLFSSNALRVLSASQPIPDMRRDKLAALQNAQLACLTQPPLRPEDLAEAVMARDGLAFTCNTAPRFDARWSDIRTAARAPLRALKLPLDGVLVIADTRAEFEWSEAAKLAGYIPSDLYFDAHG